MSTSANTATGAERCPGDDMARLRCRARALRSMADRVDPILAPTYRRRASELELEVWILEVRSGLDPDHSPIAA